MPPLKNQRQELFCREYILRPVSPGACAVVAGYSVKTAPQIASRLLTYVNVQARIAELNERAASKRVATVQERKERLSEIIRAKVTDFVVDGQIKLPDEPKNTGALLKLKKKAVKVNDAVMSEEFTEVELHNPIAAIQELNKMDGVYKESPTINVDNRSIKYEVNIDARDLAEALRTLSNTGAIRLGTTETQPPTEPVQPA